MNRFTAVRKHTAHRTALVTAYGQHVALCGKVASKTRWAKDGDAPCEACEDAARRRVAT